MTFFSSVKRFAEKTYKDNVSEDTRKRIDREIRERTENTKKYLKDIKKDIQKEEKHSSEKTSPLSNSDETFIHENNHQDNFDYNQNKNTDRLFEKIGGLKFKKEFEKSKIISFLHIREDNTKLIRIRGVPFVYILDSQSAKDSGKLIWKIGQKLFPYIVEVSIGKTSKKSYITYLIHKGWNIYNISKKKK